MATAYLLGSGGAVSDPHRTTTMLAFDNGNSLILVDCGGDVIHRFMQAGFAYSEVARIEAMILTHEHPDHIGGFALFMEKIWLAGRREPIEVYGPASALDQAKRSFEVYNTSSWTGMPKIGWNEVPLKEKTTVLDSENWKITATPGKHSVPVMGIRVEDKVAGGAIAYSCDTEPHPPIAQLGQGVDIFFHEATGEGPSHSSAQQAAEIAAHAEPKRLVFVHIPPSELLTDDMIAEASTIFPAEKGVELGAYTF